MIDYISLLSEKVQEIKPSGIRKFSELAAEMGNVISLGVGEPDFDTPWHIRDEGIYSLEKGRTFYTSNAGLKQLREEIAHYLRRRYQVSYDPLHEIMITVGGSEAIDIALRAMVNPGDEVLIPQPSYVSYEPCAVLAGAKPVIIPLKAENEFRLTAQELLDAITEKTKILILPYPNNPTGAVFGRDKLQRWVDYANRRGAVILFDAAYEAFIEDPALPHSIFELDGARTCAIEICSLSKTAGFTVIPKALERGGLRPNDMWVRNRTTKTNGVSYILQKGGAAVFTPEGQRQVRGNIQVYKANAKMLTDALDALGVWYCGGKNAPYIWMKCPEGMSSWAFFDRLLNEAQVVGTPGEGFGACGEGYFRFSTFGDPEDTKEAARRLSGLLGGKSV